MRESQLSKTARSIYFTEEGFSKIISSNELQPKKATCLIVSTVDGIVIFLSEVQPSNAISLIEVTEVGFLKITCLSDVQLAKIPLIAVKLEGIVISVSELHFTKAWSPNF